MMHLMKKNTARILVKIARFFGVVLGRMCGLVFRRRLKIKTSIFLRYVLVHEPAALDFIVYEFSHQFLGQLLRNESDIWVTKEIYRGIHLKLDIAQYSQRQFFLFKLYGSHIYHYMCSVLSEGDIFVDVGSNVGYFTLIGSALVGERGKVYGFEPEEQNFHKLSENVSRNSLTNVQVMQAALSDTEGTARLYINPINEGGHTLLESSDTRVALIPTVVFDSWCPPEETSRIRLMKIDVEGFELAVLKGMQKTLEESHMLEIICEVRRNQREVQLFMEKLGYYAYELTAQGIPVRVPDMALIKRDFLFSKVHYTAES